LLLLAALVWVIVLHRRVLAHSRALQVQTLQLQVAQKDTSEALQKACEAESLDLDSKRILELIARDEPMDLVIDQIAEAIALHCGGAVCAIVLGSRNGAPVCVVPAMPPDWLDALGQIDLRSLSFSQEMRPTHDLSEHPAWTSFVGAQTNPPFVTFCSAPIVLEGVIAGLIATFFQYPRETMDAQSARLGLWSNIAALALERRRLHDQLSYRAQHDTLTGLPNRAMLEERLQEEIKRTAGAGGLLGLIYIDLDGFKPINDTYGHDAGDAVLREISNRMTQSTRRGDTVARLGGDEFVVLLPAIGGRENARHIADKIAKTLAEPIFAPPHTLAVSACFGIAIWPLDGERSEAVLRFADEQMYGEKRRRRYETPSKPAQVDMAAI
jgi:diguanylate cyclase (GGDEF)-like protein